MSKDPKFWLAFLVAFAFAGVSAFEISSGHRLRGASYLCFGVFFILLALRGAPQRNNAMVNKKVVPFGFLFAAILALAAGLVPLVGGQSPNLIFCIFGGLFAVMAAVTSRRGNGGDGTRPSA
jgi:hypothetical protein